ncbi:MAG: hypothetical protein HOI53_09460 [Francisellaceae bacterium]|jgi:hypothetical protein|nr:hypothetical protein [Francisellaceae bacterium]MBT6208240.1 hypothetical protein [Francisellaceae bacterium]MBT6539187.1 hypothetical protein [Francisellaceae bacterium]
MSKLLNVSANCAVTKYSVLTKQMLLLRKACCGRTSPDEDILINNLLSDAQLYKNSPDHNCSILVNHIEEHNLGSDIINNACKYGATSIVYHFLKVSNHEKSAFPKTIIKFRQTCKESAALACQHGHLEVLKLIFAFSKYHQLNPSPTYFIKTYLFFSIEDALIQSFFLARKAFSLGHFHIVNFLLLEIENILTYQAIPGKLIETIYDTHYDEKIDMENYFFTVKGNGEHKYPKLVTILLNLKQHENITPDNYKTLHTLVMLKKNPEYLATFSANSTFCINLIHYVMSLKADAATNTSFHGLLDINLAATSLKLINSWVSPPRSERPYLDDVKLYLHECTITKNTSREDFYNYSFRAACLHGRTSQAIELLSNSLTEEYKYPCVIDNMKIINNYPFKIACTKRYDPIILRFLAWNTTHKSPEFKCIIEDPALLTYIKLYVDNTLAHGEDIALEIAVAFVRATEYRLHNFSFGFDLQSISDHHVIFEKLNAIAKNSEEYRGFISIYRKITHEPLSFGYSLKKPKSSAMAILPKQIISLTSPRKSRLSNRAFTTQYRERCEADVIRASEDSLLLTKASPPAPRKSERSLNDTKERERLLHDVMQMFQFEPRKQPWKKRRNKGYTPPTDSSGTKNRRRRSPYKY